MKLSWCQRAVLLYLVYRVGHWWGKSGRAWLGELIEELTRPSNPHPHGGD